jgi:nitrate/TMAO reductase-like tetraheme cytochrome c subunit
MAKKQPLPSKKRFPLIPILVVALVGIVLLTAGGFVFAANQESNDPFCASCHTQPEATFFKRSTAAQPVDLASFHTPQNTHCIDCHSGQGILERMQAELMGARNAFKWYTGTAVQPAVLSFPISDQNCLKCHQNVILPGFTPKEQITIPGGQAGERGEEGQTNHWHALLTRWQAAAPDAGTCVSCHSGHSSSVNAKNGMINNQTMQAECNACHLVLRPGD